MPYFTAFFGARRSGAVGCAVAGIAIDANAAAPIAEAKISRRVGDCMRMGVIKDQRQAFVQSLSDVPAEQSRADFRIELRTCLPRLGPFALRVPLP